MEETSIHNETLIILNAAYHLNGNQSVSYNQFEMAWIKIKGLRNFHRIRSAHRYLRKLAESGELIISDKQGNFLPIRPFIPSCVKS